MTFWMPASHENVTLAFVDLAEDVRGAQDALADRTRVAAGAETVDHADFADDET
jgi:hypothetical protein